MVWTIGFSNLSEAIPSTVYRRETLEQAAAQYPDLKLIVRDNALDDERALENAEAFAALPVDLAIIFHINERLGTQLSQFFMPKGIPVIAVDVPIPFATYFGANNQQAGSLAGQALGHWIQNHWGGQIDKVLVMTDSRVTSVVRERAEFCLKTLQEVAPYADDHVFHLDSSSRRDTAAQRSYDVLQRWTDHQHIAVVCINDDTALGVLDAARSLGCEAQIAVAGQGADELACAEIANPASALIASTEYYMGEYGVRLIELARRILAGERVPPRNYIEHTCISKE